MTSSLIDSFWTRVQVTEGCWLWTGTRDKDGYGSFRTRAQRDLGLPRLAHRVAWRIGKGPIPDGMCVLHRCDNPPCVRLDHLFLGTKRDNTLDMVRKGRHGRTHTPAIRGSAHVQSKLNDTQRAEVVARFRAGEAPRTIAERYGVTSRWVNRHLRRSGARP